MKKGTKISGNFHVNGRILIESENGSFLGAGRIELLKRIEEHGSITKASKSMGMAYRQAWHLIESMNAKAVSPLVMTAAGGKGGGGATVTEEGFRMIRQFEQLEEAFTNFIKIQSDQLGI
jgi:molybdate transport system regulatory protein